MPRQPQPKRPVVAVLAVVIRGDQVLLVQRANSPDAGFWGFPGGKVEFGETLKQATERELLEETGVIAKAQEVLGAVDVLVPASDGEMQHHFVLIALRCDWQNGEPLAADDALDARWVALDELDKALPLSRDVASIAQRAAQTRAR